MLPFGDPVLLEKRFIRSYSPSLNKYVSRFHAKQNWSKRKRRRGTKKTRLRTSEWVDPPKVDPIFVVPRNDICIFNMNGEIMYDPCDKLEDGVLKWKSGFIRLYSVPVFKFVLRK